MLTIFKYTCTFHLTCLFVLQVSWLKLKLLPSHNFFSVVSKSSYNWTGCRSDSPCVKLESYDKNVLSLITNLLLVIYSNVIAGK